ncbi:hypothetical protein PR202_ga13033 [Eleusine coracana subsp. coracana]|uniref:Glucosamine inositolphosphorylceramide transferase 1 N-terminal domain-containing protein n=1 Tax=Eleusine coracana subsp. coracana TaxID=191504 RepID=A0AAV5CD13_ELECO|nr:hypothetical protein PR202_ga13033 [Eleusine coracana subsp. coracana]
MPSPPPLPATAAHHRRSHPAPSQSAYIAVTLALHAFTALAFSRIAFPRFPHPPATRSCRPDAEGSWSAGVLLGDSPFSLKPIEDGDAIYMFFETKNPITSQGDIAAAVSKDKACLA